MTERSLGGVDRTSASSQRAERATFDARPPKAPDFVEDGWLPEDVKEQIAVRESRKSRKCWVRRLNGLPLGDWRLALSVLAALTACSPALDDSNLAWEVERCDVSEPREVTRIRDEGQAVRFSDGDRILNVLGEQYPVDGVADRQVTLVEKCGARRVADGPLARAVGRHVLSCDDDDLVQLTASGGVFQVLATDVDCQGLFSKVPGLPLLVFDRTTAEVGVATEAPDVHWTGVVLGAPDWGSVADDPRRLVAGKLGQVLIVTADDELVQIDSDSLEVVRLASGVDGIVEGDDPAWILGTRDAEPAVLVDLQRGDVFPVPSVDENSVPYVGPTLRPSLAGHVVVAAVDTTAVGPSRVTFYAWVPAFEGRFRDLGTRLGGFAAAGDTLATVFRDEPEIVRLESLGSDASAADRVIGEVQVKGATAATARLRGNVGRIFYAGTEVPLDAALAGPFRGLGDDALWLEDQVVTQIGTDLISLPFERAEAEVLAQNIAPDPDLGGQASNREAALFERSSEAAYLTKASDGQLSVWLHPL